MHAMAALMKDRSDDFIAEGLQFSCQMSGKCCSARGDYGFVYTNEDDRQRLAAELGMTEAELRATYCSQTDGHWHLNDPQRDCLFLRDNLCSVYRARPTQCSTWPFWRENLSGAGAWGSEVQAVCAGAGQGPVVRRSDILRIVAQQDRADKGAP